MTSPAKRPLLCIAIIAVAFTFMAWSTWLTWPDSMYDFGTHLYCPWQITRGRHLYTDIAYFNGPFSEYFNAGMFALFGISIHTLMVVNAAVAMGVIALVFHIVCRLSGAIPATLACLVFIIVFAFSRYLGIGNYNWICPYTHEVTHGVVLSLAMVAAMGSFLQTGKRRWLLIASLLLGLVFLTKAEVFAPAAGAFAVGMLLLRRFEIRDLSAGIMPFAIVLVAAYAMIALHSGAIAASRALLGSWPWVFNRQVAQLQFYQQGLGTDQLAENLWRMSLVGAASMALIAAAVWAAIAPRRWRALAYAVFLAELIAVACNWRWTMQLARPWPVFLVIIAGVSMVQAWRAGEGAGQKPAVRAMLAILALGLLGKMLFNARISQYGFALAMPAAIAIVEVIVGWFPAWISSRGGAGQQMRWAGAALVGVVTICLYANQISPSQETVEVGVGTDRFLADHRGGEVESARRSINALLPANGTLAVMPQGLMLNLLTRRANSVAVINVMPPEVMSVGEDQVVAELDAHPPGLIVLSEKDVSSGSFVLADGDYHYGRKILAWVMKRYRCRVPAEPRSELKLSIWALKS